MAKRLGHLYVHRPVVWVVGASRGIGKEIAAQFASIGCEVALSGRSIRQLQEVVKTITGLGGRAYPFPCDVMHNASVVAAARRIRSELGDIGVLVNNAGVTVFKSFLDTSVGEFRDIISTNLEGPIACTKAVLPGMVRCKKGWIFNILSNAAIKTFEGSAAYTATKAGMLGLARVLREELRAYNVKVVNILPGAIETDMWSAAMRRKYGHRMMRAKSVGEAVLSAYRMPDDVVVDEIVIRPIKGDIG